MHFFLSLFFIGFSLVHVQAVTKNPDVKKYLLKIHQTSQDHYLKSFKQICEKKDSLDFDGDMELVELTKKIIQKPKLLTIRALVYAGIYCTDGVSAESLQSFLGNDLLLKHPAYLIEAISEEKLGERYAPLAEDEGREWFAVLCSDEKCKADRKKYFAQKRAALKKAKIKKQLEPTRDILLKNLKSDL
jgi:hypothetical protein